MLKILTSLIALIAIAFPLPALSQQSTGSYFDEILGDGSEVSTDEEPIDDDFDEEEFDEDMEEYDEYVEENGWISFQDWLRLIRYPERYPPPPPFEPDPDSVDCTGFDPRAEIPPPPPEEDPEGEMTSEPEFQGGCDEGDRGRLYHRGKLIRRINGQRGRIIRGGSGG